MIGQTLSLSIATLLAVGLTNQPQPVVKDYNGKMLSSIFTGVKPIKHDLRVLLAKPKQCGEAPWALRMLDRVLGVKTAQAFQSNCNVSPCGGSWYYDIYESCVGGCNPDPPGGHTYDLSGVNFILGNQDTGWRESVFRGCTGEQFCPCNKPTCIL